MPFLPTAIIPKNVLTALRRPNTVIPVSAALLDAAKSDPHEVFATLKTNENGLSEEEAEERLEQYGPNAVTQEQRHPRLRLFGHACTNPLVILLLVLAACLGSDPDGGPPAILMLIMVVLGVALRFVQEARADNAAAKLKAMISVTATVVRDGQPRELPLGQLVPGDVVRLAAGDMIPADLRIISCKDLFVIQSSLTGESLPVEKFDATEDGRRQAAAGAEEHLLPGHQRGERHGHRRDRRDRASRPTWAAWPSRSSASTCPPASTRASPASPG